MRNEKILKIDIVSLFQILSAMSAVFAPNII